MRVKLVGLATALVWGALALVTPTSPATADGGPFLTGLTVHPEWGSVSVPSGTLRKGCKLYGYNYSFAPPPGDWAVEMFVSGPSGEALWSGGYLNGSDPLSGSGYFKFCGTSTTPGTFLIEAKLSVQNGPGPQNYTEGQLPPATFVLSARVKKQHDSIIVPFGQG